MATSIRINDTEQELLRKKAVELNKILINNNKQPIRDSELVHLLIEHGTELLEVTVSGKVTIVK